MERNGNRGRAGRLPALLLGLGLAGLCLDPAGAAEGARRGLSLCLETVIPSLFPFFTCSSLAVELGLARQLSGPLGRLMGPLFGVGGGCAAPLALGLLGGYPVGPRSLLELRRAGGCAGWEARRLLFFCNNCGPAFLLGVVGAGIFGDPRMGLLLWGTHGAGALLLGLLARLLFPREGDPPSPPPQVPPEGGGKPSLTGCVTRAFGAMAHVCAFVVFFAALLGLLEGWGVLSRLAALLAPPLAPLGLGEGDLLALLTGLLELTSGVWALGEGGSAPLRPVLAALLLGWGGLSVQLQTRALLEGSGLPLWPCLAGKVLHGLLSAGLTALALALFPAVLPAWAPGPAPSPLPWVLPAAGVALLLLAPGKTSGKRGRPVV